tara:strand:+ start:110 stop:499 length:390 start_codon:yes stop_codon:yes gene_type:complete
MALEQEWLQRLEELYYPIEEKRAARLYQLRACFSPNCLNTSTHPKILGFFTYPQSPPALRISIAKKNFKLAVDRNKIKRQIKEIFKTNNLIAGKGLFVVLVYKPFGELKYHEASVEIVKAVESLYQKGI